MEWFDDRRKHVLEETPSMADGLTLPHHSIVTKPSTEAFYQYSTDGKLPIENMCLACEAGECPLQSVRVDAAPSRNACSVRRVRYNGSTLWKSL